MQTWSWLKRIFSIWGFHRMFQIHIVFHTVYYIRYSWIYTGSWIWQWSGAKQCDIWSLLLTWFNFNPSLDMWLQLLEKAVWNYLSIPNFNGCTVEVWEWISNFIAYFTVHVITYPCWDYSQSMSVKGATDVTVHVDVDNDADMQIQSQALGGLLSA